MHVKHEMNIVLLTVAEELGYDTARYLLGVHASSFAVSSGAENLHISLVVLDVTGNMSRDFHLT